MGYDGLNMGQINTENSNSIVTKKWNEELEYRMYGLVPYNLSPIQQGIQFGHAVQEYNNMVRNWLNQPGGVLYSTLKGRVFKSFEKWREKDKTFIILNGGTTNWNKKGGSAEYIGTLNEHLATLENHGVPVGVFKEPDLGDQLTGVVFLVDERVWDYEKYPPRDAGGPSLEDAGSTAVVEIYIEPETKEAYAKRLGGPHNVWMREFLSQFRLA